MQHIPHARRRGICYHYEAKVGRRLVEMQLILAGPVANEGVVVAAELAGHVTERENGSEDEFGVI